MNVEVIQKKYTVVVDSPSRVNVLFVGTQGPQGPAGPSGLAARVVGETPSGAINGSNATFITAFRFVPESVEVVVNGLTQKKPDDFNTSGSQTILMSSSPEANTNLLVNYLRS